MDEESYDAGVNMEGTRSDGVIADIICPFEDECEEGEVDMDDYGEEGEVELLELASGS